jgi:hypothetical protein
VSKALDKPKRNKMIYESKKATTPAQLFRSYPKVNANDGHVCVSNVDDRARRHWKNSRNIVAI